MDIPVTRSSMPSFEEYVEEIKELWESHWLTNMGIKHKTLEEQLKKYLGVNGISLFCNGHMALEMAIQAMNLSGEVITTPFTFASTTHAIVRNGLTPVFCDINEKDYTIDVDKIETLITDKTSAIIPVHVYGNMCDVERIEKLARKYDLKVIYDAAHAFGVKYKGKSAAVYGDAAMFSFHATKVYNTIEGGAVCFESDDYGLDLYRIKNFGIRNEEVVDAVGANAKMNEFQAAMGICNLRHLDEEIAKRKIAHDIYIEQLKGIKGLYLPQQQENVESNYAYFPIRINENEFGMSRDALYLYLKEHGVFSRKYFYPLTNSFECYRDKFDVEKTPVALSVSNEVLTLPLYAELSEADVKKICKIIAQRAKA
ncbi:DegT/DnrJ/EryC1/StrS family aminotransferase [Anaerosacchariphilus sp. NSJ-68]|uniref:DegT/DnrJ/EryC1/StrS family aminotransferase n=2 Tax=Lachnospiraceae TaxID=186803 RepID=A0A923LAM1_9FIRM|nr:MULTISPECIES: DegT/DnrJ/EryC1/StrS family aminotransferase [Lachnospiraceae]MBC5658709.1 DegT/DnrJ/EryC1/StrS family aminotransferase [Anaerosacchariphilus hominis]MBC5699022.1 DegT/DnrJ/EryC1/StrS family aminotransferase [Roseburia difficilis]